MTRKEATILKKDKEKKKRLSLKKTVSNIVFAFKQVWNVSKTYFFTYYLITLLQAPIDFLGDSFLIRMIVNGYENNVSTKSIVIYIAAIGAATLVIFIISQYFWDIYSPAKHRLIGSLMQKKLFDKASRVELACYESPDFYDKYVKAMEESKERIMTVMETLDILIWYVITLALNSFLIFYIDPVLIAFALVPLLLGFARHWSNRLGHDFAAERKKADRRFNYVRRTFYLNEYAKEMRVGFMAPRMLRELRLTYLLYRDLYRKFGFRIAAAEFIQSYGLEGVTVLGAMLYSVWRTLGDGGMTVGDCIVVLNSIGLISYCINDVVTEVAAFGEHAMYIEDIRAFLDYEPAIKDGDEALMAHGGDVSLENVSFRYEGAEKDTIKNVTLRIKAGEKIALVGQNGSGKSTLVKLLLRLYDPTEGRITLDGNDARSYIVSSYRSNFSCVFQDFKLFSASVAENVMMRQTEETDRDKVVCALKKSGVYEKIMTLDNGIDTILTREFDENGANLSVGEQQKIALARVFAADASFIILDEPSSALDPVAEHDMFENMSKAAQGRSVVFISHRLSSAVDADRVILLDHGRIVEEGSHRELMEKGGEYAKMFAIQAANYLGGEETE